MTRAAPVAGSKGVRSLCFLGDVPTMEAITIIGTFVL
jgi:hypothetical protein